MYRYGSIDPESLYKKYLDLCLPEGDRYGLNPEVVLSRAEFIDRIDAMEPPDRIALIDALQGNDDVTPESINEWTEAFEEAEEMLLDAPNSSPKQRFD